ncbi:MAG: tetratricopeptide repeat protein [Thermoanaerobaculia bacterium]|nr:MAG: tetratricopeptide repeat protein [Thermoanaerobaculia bacterium]
MSVPPPLSPPTAPASLLRILLGLRARRATGVLEIQAGGSSRRLFLVEGELHLPGGHPLAQRVAERLAALRAQRGRPLDPEDPLHELVQRIGEVFSEWRPERWTFRAGLGALPTDLVGPLPTWRVLGVMAGAGLDDAEVERRLGDPEQRLVAVPVAPDPTGLGPTPEEALLLERLRLPMNVAEVLAGSPVPRPELARHLARLLALGAVRWADGAPEPEPAADREFVARIAERIERGLADQPLALSVEEQRARVADLLVRHGGLDHYELLGIPALARVEEVQVAFEELARLTHPVHATRLGLPAGERALRVLFEAAARAYETLMDPERRRRYNESQLIELPAGGPTGERREAERREVARAVFERAQAYAGAGELHNAILLLEQAVQTDPRSEYWAALARLQARNPSWSDRALASFRQAIQLDPNSADIRFGVGQLFEQLGDLERARAQYAAALRLNPGHLEANARMAEVSAARGEGKAGRGGLLSRFFRREP